MISGSAVAEYLTLPHRQPPTISRMLSSCLCTRAPKLGSVSPSERRQSLYANFIEQRPRLLEIGGIEPFGEAIIDRTQQRIARLALFWGTLQPAQRHCGPQFEQTCALRPRDFDRTLKT